MTLEEATKVGGVVAQCDGGCSTCIFVLVKFLNEQFPEFHWEMVENSDVKVIVRAK